MLREAGEETGLTDLSVRRYLGSVEEALPEGPRVMQRWTRVYARPDRTSFDWAHLRRGLVVDLLREERAFFQVCYTEPDREPDPRYVTMQILGWVPKDALARTRRRHFFELAFAGETAPRWTTFTDRHTFTLFWARLSDLPGIASPPGGLAGFFDRG